MKRTLYLGLNSPDTRFTHYPVLQIKFLPHDNENIISVLNGINEFTHLVITSKSALFFFDHLPKKQQDKFKALPVFSVGQASAQACQKLGFAVADVAPVETAEGLCSLLEQYDLQQAHLFWPHSSLARDVLPTYTQKKSISLSHCAVYTTHMQCIKPIPNLHDFDEVIFTSPSTVDHFIKIFGSIPKHLTLSCIGPITQAKLDISLSPTQS